LGYKKFEGNDKNGPVQFLVALYNSIDRYRYEQSFISVTFSLFIFTVYVRVESVNCSYGPCLIFI
jgi:hypothetical protein